MPLDSSQNLYEDCGNVRITFVPRRSDARDWSGSDGIRIQAYRDDPKVSQALLMGAEFPIASEGDLLGLIETLCQIYRQGRQQSRSGTR
jgi:hypothetical protein